MFSISCLANSFFDFPRHRTSRFWFHCRVKRLSVDFVRNSTLIFPNGQSPSIVLMESNSRHLNLSHARIFYCYFSWHLKILCYRFTVQMVLLSTIYFNEDTNPLLCSLNVTSSEAGSLILISKNHSVCFSHMIMLFAVLVLRFATCPLFVFLIVHRSLLVIKVERWI